MENESVERVEKTVYLDHAGAALPSAAQMEAIFGDMRRSLPTNPHSSHTSSRRTHDLVEQTRIRLVDRILSKFFHMLTILGYYHIFTLLPTSIKLYSRRAQRARSILWPNASISARDHTILPPFQIIFHSVGKRSPTLKTVIRRLSACEKRSGKDAGLSRAYKPNSWNRSIFRLLPPLPSRVIVR